MALVSPTKKIDLEIYAEMAEIVQICHRMYVKEPTPTVGAFIQETALWMENWRKKIDTHDYTAADKAYWRFQKLSPHAQR